MDSELQQYLPFEVTSTPPARLDRGRRGSLASESDDTTPTLVAHGHAGQPSPARPRGDDDKRIDEELVKSIICGPETTPPGIPLASAPPLPTK